MRTKITSMKILTLKKIMKILLLFFIPLIGCAQDTIIKNNALISHFSGKYHNPLYVEYTLYKGGGDCNRTQFTFKTGDIKNSAIKKDYVSSGFDIGHLCPAEDFAYNCDKEKETFYFYNAVPQYPNLNRGIWKKFETKIRKESQNDSLLIITGSIYRDNYTIKNTVVSIPINCWKLVMSLSTKKVLYCLLFTNKIDNNSVEYISVDQLEKLIGYKLTK